MLRPRETSFPTNHRGAAGISLEMRHYIILPGFWGGIVCFSGGTKMPRQPVGGFFHCLNSLSEPGLGDSCCSVKDFLMPWCSMQLLPGSSVSLCVGVVASDDPQQWPWAVPGYHIRGKRGFFSGNVLLELLSTGKANTEQLQWVLKAPTN